MAGEYDINLSNGSVLATLYPLEVNGPDNRSTPRFIQDVQTSPNGFVLNGDLTYRFIEGFVFDVQNSGSYAGSPSTYFGNDGTYMVGSGGAVGIGSPITQTFIPATLVAGSPVGSPAVGSPIAPLNTGLPFGQIQYAVPVTVGSPEYELNTSLKLPGKGTINYGEAIIENLVRMTEHWAADTQPDLNTNIGSNPYATPLVGQIWYKTEAGDVGFKYWDGTQWADLGTGGTGIGGGVNVRYERQCATAGQSVFNLSTIVYGIGTNRLFVYVDGVKQQLVQSVGSCPTGGYVETDSSTVTFVGSPTAFEGNEIVEFYTYDETTANATIVRIQKTGITSSGSPISGSPVSVGSPVSAVINFSSPPTGFTYTPGTDTLFVYLNGQKVVKNIDYTEDSPTQVSWIGVPLVSTDLLEFYAAIPVIAGVLLGDIADVNGDASYGPPNDGDVLVYDSATGLWVPQTADKPQYVQYVSQSGGGPHATASGSVVPDNGTNGLASLQVFVNGVYQIGGLNYVNNGDGTITLVGSPLPDPYDLVIYEF